MTPEELDELERLEKAATRRASKRWALDKSREDETAQVYAPNRGPLRVIVPIAETTKEDGELIAALRNAAPSLIAEARFAMKARVSHEQGVKDWRAERDAELRRAMAIVSRCLTDCDVEGLCWFCDWKRNAYQNPAGDGHEATCPLVSQGFIDESGARKGTK